MRNSIPDTNNKLMESMHMRKYQVRHGGRPGHAFSRSHVSTVYMF